MILTEMIGGLGNQMFQYAAGLALAHQSGVALRYSDAGFDEYQLRQFTLTDFGISGKRASLAERSQIAREGRLIVEAESRFEPKLLDRHRCAYLRGYWQSERYFISSRSRLLSEFVPIQDIGDINRLTIERMRNSVSIAMHVRRGDYVTNNHTNAFHGTLPIAYYQAALTRINAEIGLSQAKNVCHFIFSDDPDWCRDNFGFLKSIEIVSHNLNGRPALDIHLMQHCRHHIIANSSFSWWGAWLNDDPEQIVVAPKNWFRKTTIDCRHIVPERWHRI